MTPDPHDIIAEAPKANVRKPTCNPRSLKNTYRPKHFGSDIMSRACAKISGAISCDDTSDVEIDLAKSTVEKKKNATDK